MIEELKELGVNPVSKVKPKSDKLAGKTFVLTGTLQNMTRDEASAIIKSHGGKTSSSVSKKHLTFSRRKCRIKIRQSSKFRCYNIDRR